MAERGVLRLSIGFDMGLISVLAKG
jgi:hypothetical protein